MTCDLTDPIFTNETAAVAHLEAGRWPHGVSCPLCGSADKAKKMGGQTQAGMFLCGDCRGKFTVRTGTVFERSHIPLHKWLLATHLMASSKKGISAHQLHRMLGITYKSAWFMAHRIREAMAPATVPFDPLGGEGKIIEMDETYVGKKKSRKLAGKNHPGNIKQTVVSLVERGGPVRSFHVKEPMNKKVARDLMFGNVDKASDIVTDDSQLYQAAGAHYIQHSTVNHSADEYARGDIHTNTIEGVFSIFKRGMIGTYQHCGEQHLQRYLNEFDFRYSNRTKLGFNDVTRAAKILKGAEGKRLTYRQVG